MKTQKQFGFALLEVLLAVLVFAVATYGVIVFSSRYIKSAQVNAVEHEAALISSNYLPYLDTTLSNTGTNLNDDPISDNQFSTDFLKSIGISDGDLQSPTDITQYVLTHLPIGGGTSKMAGVRSTVTATGDNSKYMDNKSVLILGFKATGSQVNALLSDEKNNFAIYIGGGSFSSAYAAGPLDQFVATSNKDNIYNVYFLYPAVLDPGKVTFDAAGNGFTAP